VSISGRTLLQMQMGVKLRFSGMTKAEILATQFARTGDLSSEGPANFY
jgi:hypothetical protein